MSRLTSLFDQDCDRFSQGVSGAAVRSVLAVLAVLRERPLCNLRAISERSGLTVPTMSKAVQKLINVGIVHELTGQRRNRVLAYTAYLDILNREELEIIEPKWEGATIFLFQSHSFNDDS